MAGDSKGELGRGGMRTKLSAAHTAASARSVIGPSAEAMRKLGDKIGAKLIAEEVGVPVAAWSRGGVDTLDEAVAAAAQIGYPLMLKATAGGGGRGIRKVTSDADLRDAYTRTRLAGDRGDVFGTLPQGVDTAAILDRATPKIG